MTEYFWLVELRPAFEGHPPFPATYYAGFGMPIDCEQTTDPYRAARWVHKEDAEKAAEFLLPTLSCVWEAVEHGFESAR